MTLFIPLSDQSTWNHNELRYALRSWVKYGSVENVLIIGHRPEWLQNVHHVPYLDQRYPKVENIFRKVKMAAELYPEFILANDDHFLMEPIADLPYYYSCKLKDFKGHAGDTFFRYVDTTARLFPDGKYFDIHTPMICRKEIIDQLDYKKDVLFKSYYCNTAGVEGVQLEDCKISGHIRRDQIESYVKGRPFISTGESISLDLKKYLLERFPNPCTFEK